MFTVEHRTKSSEAFQFVKVIDRREMIESLLFLEISIAV